MIKRFVVPSLIVLALFVTGCGAPQPPMVITATPMRPPTATPTPRIDVEEVTLTAEDNVEIVGRLFRGDASGEDGLVVVLAHMGDPDLVSGVSDQTSWESFARRIAGRGFAAFTFDFRCYGRSGCGRDGGPHFLKDMRAVVAFLRNRGYERIACVGASLGGTACGNIAMETELAGLAIIASTTPREHSYPDDLVSPGMDKLFIVTENDYSAVVANIQQMYENAPEPKAIQIFTGDVHGTNLFHTEHRDEFSELLLSFLEGLR